MCCATAKLFTVNTERLNTSQYQMIMIKQCTLHAQYGYLFIILFKLQPVISNILCLVTLVKLLLKILFCTNID